MQESDNLTILDIALDCGFNSQASFYRAFKKFEGMTPKAYLDSKK
ncbi:MAG: helix-turn-helix transcriptional regulator [Xanthomonadales bacterium]|nr:helix-turn-helix transcriptional regulator [Xanthomonadales bacterium]